MVKKARQTKKNRQKVDGKTTTELFSEIKVKRSKGKSDIRNTKLYGTTGYVKPIKAAKKKINQTKFEMIMLWSNGQQPFTTQKLEFNAGRGMQRGWEEAGKIRRLLIRAGNFRSRDMKIIAVGMSGALEAYVSEYKVKINADKVSLRKAIRHILRRKIK